MVVRNCRIDGVAAVPGPKRSIGPSGPVVVVTSSPSTTKVRLSCKRTFVTMPRSPIDTATASKTGTSRSIQAAEPVPSTTLKAIALFGSNRREPPVEPVDRKPLVV